MANINKKLNIVVFGFQILAILVIGMTLSPTLSYASTYGRTCGEAGCNYNFGTTPGVNNNTSYTVISYYPVEPTPTVYSSSTAKKAPVKKTGEVLGAETESASHVAAAAVYGENSFLPSGILQWILFAIFVLIIIILIRKIFGGEKKYHETPLKHA